MTELLDLGISRGGREAVGRLAHQAAGRARCPATGRVTTMGSRTEKAIWLIGDPGLQENRDFK